MTRSIGRWATWLMVGCLLAAQAGCGGRMPEDLGIENGRLRPCPESPNCVSSFATDEQHGIASLAIEGPPAAAWDALGSELESRERVEIVASEAGYLHAVFTTKLMRYRDDVEFLLRPQQDEIAVRSASRVGYGDMGANRARIESLRAALGDRGVVRMPTDD